VAVGLQAIRQIFEIGHVKRSASRRESLSTSGSSLQIPGVLIMLFSRTSLRLYFEEHKAAIQFRGTPEFTKRSIPFA